MVSNISCTFAGKIDFYARCIFKVRVSFIDRYYSYTAFIVSNGMLHITNSAFNWR